MPVPQQAPRRFPIIGGPSILWDVIAPYEAQAVKNHSQSLRRLAERGGLSPAETWCVMHNAGLFGPEWKTAEEYGLRFVQELIRAEHAPRYSADAVDEKLFCVAYANCWNGHRARGEGEEMTPEIKRAIAEMRRRDVPFRCPCKEPCINKQCAEYCKERERTLERKA